MTERRKLVAEGIGTFWLVLGGCGTAVIAGPSAGQVGIALAFGLSVLTIAYVLGPISGAHLNPAVTIGGVIAGRFPARDAGPYIIAQLIGAIAAALLLFLILHAQVGTTDLGTFASNGYGARSPAGYSLGAALLTEIVLTAMFVLVVLGVTDPRATAGGSVAAPLAIGLALTVVHLISIPVTNTSVNPARSTSQALFAGGPALVQLWLFWVAPLLGAGAGGWIYARLFRPTVEPAVAVEPTTIGPGEPLPRPA
jgi:aquaporin Z